MKVLLLRKEIGVSESNPFQTTREAKSVRWQHDSIENESKKMMKFELSKWEWKVKISVKVVRKLRSGFGRSTDIT